MKDFYKKRILIFAPRFFDYEIEIAKKLSQFGAKVSLYDERPSNSFITKVLIRLKPNLMKKFIIKHFEKIMYKEGPNDIILFFKGETVLKEVLILLKERQPKAEIILYLIDSLDNYPHIINSFKFFDKILTFDPLDSERYSIKFRPLFFLSEYSKIENNLNYQIDILFIGTIHSDRWPFLQQIKEQAILNNFKVFYYLYFPSPYLYLFRKIFSKNFRSIPFSEAKFIPLKKAEILALIGKSKVILDIQHPKQTGLTIRTIEVLGAKKKIITTNKNIKEYDFYNIDNVSILDRDYPLLDSEFIKSPFHPINTKIYNKYSLESWLMDIFTCET